MESPTSILFLVLCLASGDQCCKVFHDNEEISEVNLLLQNVYPKDNQLAGEKLIEYTTSGITELFSQDDYIDVKFDGKNNTVTVVLKKEFETYEENNNKTSWSFNAYLYCQEDRTNKTMSISVTVTDTDNHKPKFNEMNLTYTLPMPYPPGLEITHEDDIWAYDFDLTSALEITVEDGSSTLLDFAIELIKERPFWPKHDNKYFYRVHIQSKSQLNTDDNITYTLIAKDRKSPNSIAKLTVTIKSNHSTSVPNPPEFNSPLYKTSVTYTMKPGDALQMSSAEIGFKNHDTSSIHVKFSDEVSSEYFSVKMQGKGVEITLEKEIEDHDERYELLIIQADIEKGNRSGYTVVYVQFPPYVCPSTSTAATVSCPKVTCPTHPPTAPMLPTTTATTMTDPCSQCPTKAECNCPTTAEVPSTPRTTEGHHTNITSPPSGQPGSSLATQHPVVTTSSGVDKSSVSHGTTMHASSWFSKTTQDTSSTTICNCPICPQVTCPTHPPTAPMLPTTTATTMTDPCSQCPTKAECNCPTTAEVPSTPRTTEGHHTNITSPPSGQPGSSLATQHPVVTTSSGVDKSSVSHGTTMHASSWFSKTTQDTSSTTICNCPICPQCNFTTSISDSTPMTEPSTPGANCTPCPECPGMSTTLPMNANLTFPVPYYQKQIKAGDIGLISRILVYCSPSYLSDLIDYKLDLPDDLEGELLITDHGELYSIAPIMADSYQFNVTAEVPGVTSKATVKFILIVTLVDFCPNGTDVSLVFPYSFISKTIAENHKYTLPPIDIPDDLNCSLVLKKETPTKGMIDIEASSQKIVISVMPIDRELQIFKGAITPTIVAELSATCSKNNKTKDFSFLTEPSNDVSSGNDILTVLISVKDENDNPPEFTTDIMIIGYPDQDISDKEKPSSMGTAVAFDKDVGENAVVTYSLNGTNEVIVDSETGIIYPHPKNFQYENTSFSIIASDRSNNQNTLTVLVKILTRNYITVLNIGNSTVENVPRLTQMISEETGLQIGVISARMESVKSKKIGPRFLFIPDNFELRNRFLSQGINSKTDAVGARQDEDDSVYLRLVIYALNGSDPVSVDLFNRSLNGNSSSSKWNLQHYHEENDNDTHSGSGSEGLLAAVIALGTILGIIIFGTAGFVAYRKCRANGGNGRGSLEKGLVDQSSESDNSSNAERKDNGLNVFGSESGSVKGELDGFQDEMPFSEAVSPERKKSVAFAEEPEVIPSEEELEGSPVDDKGAVLGVDEDIEDLRM